jgi:hypothetical protein
VQDLDREIVVEQSIGLVDEGVDEAQQLVARHGRERPGLDVHDAETGLDLDHRHLLRVLGTRVDVARDTGARERRRERAHVDVHAPTVARARLRERRGVHAENRYTPHRARR